MTETNDITVRKETVITQRIEAEGERQVEQPTTKAAAVRVFENPFAGDWQEDLGLLAEYGAEIGDSLTRAAVDRVGGQEDVESYGKGVIVGTSGEREHAAALLHPRLGGPMRDAVGGGEAIIPSNRKVAEPGATLDVPTHGKDDVLQFSHFDTMSISLPDAPNPDEILVAIVLTDGGRPHPRIEQLR